MSISSMIRKAMYGRTSGHEYTQATKTIQQRELKEKWGKQNKAQAEKLQKLREERIRLEGKAKLAKTETKERARIAAAKSQTSVIGKIGRFVKAARKDAKKLKGKKTKAAYGKPKAEPPRPSVFTMGGGNEGGKPPFSF